MGTTAKGATMSKQTNVYWYYKGTGIDGTTITDGVVAVSDPMAWAMEFMAPIGVMTGTVDVAVSDTADDTIFKVVVDGSFRSLGEPLETYRVAEWNVEERELG